MEFVCDNDYRALIPDKVYEAQCVSYDSSFVLGKARKLFLNFRIIDPGEHNGVELFMAFNMPYTGRIKSGSKYYKKWCQVNGFRKPSRNATMSPRLFLNKVYKLKTRTVRPERMPESFQYSVVDDILKVVAG